MGTFTHLIDLVVFKYIGIHGLEHLMQYIKTLNQKLTVAVSWEKAASPGTVAGSSSKRKNACLCSEGLWLSGMEMCLRLHRNMWKLGFYKSSSPKMDCLLLRRSMANCNKLKNSRSCHLALWHFSTLKGKVDGAHLGY